MPNQRCVTLLIFILAINRLCGQTARTYVNEQGERHLCGPVTVSNLQSHGDGWFQRGYDAYNLEKKKRKWKRKLKRTKVEIYLGTWCYDTKIWVPRFIRLWDLLGFKRKKLTIFALYDLEEKYKQGPNDEEEEQQIHHVPTFIFKKNGKEIGRIVESPVTNLETDFQQIAYGYPTTPHYRAAAYIMSLLEYQTVEEIYEKTNQHFLEVYKRVSNSSELNTLGSVFLKSGRLDEALLTFQFNSHLFKTDPMVYASYAEALHQAGEVSKAIFNYKKALELDPYHQVAKEQLTLLQTNTEDR